jgi:iron uptake system component EfeO
MTMMKRLLFAPIALAALAIGCSSSSDGKPETDAQFTESIKQDMHDSLQANLQKLVQGTTALQAAAPDHPWDSSDPAVAAMQTAWIEARQAYEQIEGATAPIFPNIDLSIDGRVEDFGPSPGAGTLNAQCDMFDGSCMTGLHAVERILYVNTTPASVTAYETGLGYVPPQSYPMTQQQADDFKNKLCAKAVSDANDLLSGWTPTVIDIGSAFQGLTSLMNEQAEKVTKAGLFQEESRYSQHTMDDLRQNLTGTTNIYQIFAPWIRTKTGGTDVDDKIQAGFTGLQNLYNSGPYMGLALPTPPDDWSDTNPSATDLMTPFGQLFSAVRSQTDPTVTGSIAYEMNVGATLCDLPVFTPGG